MLFQFYPPTHLFLNCVTSESAELEIALHWGVSLLDILTCVL